MDHIQGESQAVSSFAKSKTLKQQREFLPIYAVREKVGIPLYLNVCPVYWEIAAFSQTLLKSLRPLTLAPPPTLGVSYSRSAHSGSYLM